MTTPRPEGVPAWLIERLALGELDEAKANELRARMKALGTEETEKRTLSALAASNAEILAAFPPAQVVAEIQHRAALPVGHPRPSQARAMRPWWALSMATACAATVAMILAVRGPGNLQPSGKGTTEAENITLKGDLKPSLRIYRKTPSGSEILRAGMPVHQGDTLQIRYVAGGRRFGLVASVDARGTVTLHLPETPGMAAPLERDGERALAHAYQLDDSPGFERFLFVTSDMPFQMAEVVDALQNGSPLPPALTLFELVLKKEKP
jgi:hypothetical protein